MPSDAAAIPILKVDGELTAPQKADPTSIRLYNELNPSVVRVETAHSAGSGFAVGKSGQILTNFHCVSGDDEVFVRTADGQRYRARIKSADDIKDLALLEIEGKAPAALKPLPLGDDKSLKPGQQVNAIGHPEGVPENYLSPGTLVDMTTNLKRFSLEQIKEFAGLDLDGMDKKTFLENDLLHANIQIRHGNSGGPAVDNDGKVVGVTVYAKELPAKDGYFVPASDVKTFLNEKPKFSFGYEYKLSAEWPREYLQNLKDHPLLTTGLSAGTLYMGARTLGSVGRIGNGLSAGAAAYGGLGLLEDLPSLRAATNNRDMLKAGLSTLGDSSLLAGGLARSWMGVGTRLLPAAGSGLLSGAESKLATTVGAGLLGSTESGLLKGAVAGTAERYLSSAGKVGLVLIAAGITAKLVSDLIPNRLVNTGVQRNDGSRRPLFGLAGH